MYIRHAPNDLIYIKYALTKSFSCFQLSSVFFSCVRPVFHGKVVNKRIFPDDRSDSMIIASESINVCFCFLQVCLWLVDLK